MQQELWSKCTHIKKKKSNAATHVANLAQWCCAGEQMNADRAEYSPLMWSGNI